jgi:rhamnose transport system permease protein
MKAAGWAVLALAAILALGAPGFFTAANLRDLALNNVATLITATGLLLVILLGEIDISVGSQFAVCGLVIGVAPWAAPVAGMALGLANGALCGGLRLPSIVVSLAAMVALRDAIRWTTQGAWITLPAGFQWAGLGQDAGQWLVLGIAVLIVALLGWALANVGLLRNVYAVGANAEAAHLAGLPVAAVRIGTFAALGAMVGIAAWLNALRFNEVQPSAGTGLELKAIAAVVVGGASIRGGRGTMAGTVTGVVLLGMIGAALTFLGVSAYWEKAIQGAIILAAVVLDRWGGRDAR